MFNTYLVLFHFYFYFYFYNYILVETRVLCPLSSAHCNSDVSDATCKIQIDCNLYGKVAEGLLESSCVTFLSTPGMDT